MILQQGTSVHASYATEQVVPILAYHRIAADGPADLAAYRIRPEVFAEQICWLRQHDYQSVSINSLARALRGEQTLPERAVMLTFDDGYADFVEAAWPILEKYGFSAVVFIVTGTVGGKADWDASFGDPAPLMPWSDIRALHEKGVEFGSHTHRHKRLRELTDQELGKELGDSRVILEHAMGRRIQTVAYPFGDHDARVCRAAIYADYDLGFTIRFGLASPSCNPLRLPRLAILGHHGPNDFAGLVSGR